MRRFSGTAPRFVRWLPRGLYALAALTLLSFLVPSGSRIGRALEWLWQWVVPFNPIDLASALVLMILGAALALRKRAAWWVTMAMMAATLLVLALAAVVFALAEPSYLSWDLLTSAALPLVLLVGLLVHRDSYRARTQRRGVLKGIGVLVAGSLVTLLVVLLVHLVAGDPGPGGTSRALARLVGLGPSTSSGWLEVLLGVGLSISIVLAAWTTLRSQHRAERITLSEERRIRELLAADSEDSLGYFATRRDRSALLSTTGGVTYRVEQGVCLVAGDPLGPPETWEATAAAFLDHARTYGWVPAVLAASRRGAEAYHAAGLQVLHVGDEAILRTADFALPALPEVARMTQRLRSLGYTTRIRRQRDIPAEELARLGELAEQWRHGETERGFSMALGRTGDAADGLCLHVEAVFPPGEGPLAGTTAGLLSFVPWGAHGVSLDVMRRHPEAENGVTEFMVAELMQDAGDLGISTLSLNFAVFRSAFEQGKELGAGPLARWWRNVLLFASRFWQLESLYRSNEKYGPDWVPRMLCYPDGSDLARIGLAVSIAEGFLTPPRWLYGTFEKQPVYTEQEAEPLLGIEPVSAPPAPAARVPEQMRHRLAVREAMLAQDVQPYPAVADAADAADAAEETAGGASAQSLRGRVLGIRDHGGVVFLDLRDEGRDHQVVLERSALSEQDFRRLRRWLSRGDRIVLHGREGVSRTGTPSFLATSWAMAAKSLRPWPHLYEGVQDPETKVRRRYLDFTLNTPQRDIMVARARAFRAIRETLQEQDFLEVETPILQTVHGGANARPFTTHINAYRLDLYLRIAPELYLKRLVVGGFDRVFEMGRNFRNEGVDATHNPEFSMLEAYCAGGDYTTMRELTRTLVLRATEAALGTTVIRGSVKGVVHEIDLAEDWTTISLTEVVSRKLGEEVTPDTDLDVMRRLARGVGVQVNPRWGWGMLLQEIYEEVAESSTVTPTFYSDFPAETSPLTRQHRRDPRLAEKWDLIVFGSELGTAYSELVDPVIQRDRLTAQSLAAAGGDPEAMQLDEDFLLALEHGMPPAGGMGMGLDRLIMLLVDQSIRSTITFPLTRPRGF